MVALATTPPTSGQARPLSAASGLITLTAAVILEEDLEYARRLMRASVPTELHVYPGAYHGFRMVADAQVTQAAQRDQLNALKRAFGQIYRSDK